MSILFVSKNCGACRRLKQETQIPQDIKVVEAETATDAELDIAIGKNIRAFPCLVQDNGKICTGVNEIQSCIAELKRN